MHPIERLRYVARASGSEHGVLVRETAAALSSFTSDPNGLVTACRRIVARQPLSGPLLWLCARVLMAPDPRGETWRAVEEIEGDATVSSLAHALPDDATVLLAGWPDLAAAAATRRGDLRVLVADVAGEGAACASWLRRADVDVCDVAGEGVGAAAVTADLVLVEAHAVGPDAAVAAVGSRAAAAVAAHAGVDVWLVVGVGRVLPARMWDAYLARLEASLVARGDEPWEASWEVVPLDLVGRAVGPGGLADVASVVTRGDCPVAPELLRSDLVL